MTRDRDARHAAYRKGLRAEWVAAWLLRLKGFRVLAARFKTPAGEIDLIARRGQLIVFVEVKARGDEARAVEAVTPAAKARIARAASLYLNRHPRLATLDRRFDIVFVAPGRLPVHRPGAFESPLD
ncbi:YraN family protein [Chthonobacter albigriseus]|uniref:YraN family protein n=1 Tax=Chthonobacter albigriseus TaxID=1683161 RepID=UPI0015EFABDD|nr:YraN family protein [Chthonobacter albigriseus]